MPNGAQVTVQYFDRVAARGQFNQGIQRNDANYKQVGWYWTEFRGILPSSAATWRGPYTSSASALSIASLSFLKPRTKKRATPEAVVEPVSRSSRRTSGKRLAGG